MIPFPPSTATPRSAIAVGVNGGMNERGGGLCVDARPLLTRICAKLLLLYMRRRLNRRELQLEELNAT